MRSPPAELSPVQHHPAEGQVIVDGRDQPPATRLEGGGTAPLAVPRIIVNLQLPSLGVCPVATRPSVDLRGRRVKPGVFHPEGLEDALAEERLQRPAGGARDQDAEHLGARLVHPPLARVVDQGKTAEASHPLVGRERGRVRPRGDPRLLHRPLDRVQPRGSQHRPYPEPQGQQVAQRDRPVRGHGVFERPVKALENLAVGQLGQQGVDRIVEPQPAFFHQDHGRHGRDRLGHRGDAEDGVPPHRVAAADRLRADRIDARLAAPAGERDDTGRVAALDVPGHDAAHPVEPRPGESPAAHRLLSPDRLIRPRPPVLAARARRGTGGLSPAASRCGPGSRYRAG